LCLESANLCQGETGNQKWYGSLIQTSGLLWIWIWTSVLDSLPCWRQSFCQWHLSQAPPKQSAMCYTRIIPAPPANCQFIWMASAFGVSATQPILGWLDHTLSYRKHLTKTARKLKNRNNLLIKLASSTWDASANNLQSSALALCYPAAEYCAPVWSRSAHTSQVDVQLKSTMRLISGTLHSTPLPWLPVLSNIEPPAYEGRLPMTS